MIVKRIRKFARRQHRPLHHVRTSIDVLTTYVLNAGSERVSSQDGENALARYVLDAQILHGHAVGPGEKVDYHGTRNLVGDELSQHQRQMLAANLLAPRAMDPIEHYVLSWQNGEVPTREQIDEAIDIFAQEMRYENCQIVWATHSNTQNYHLHLVVNRIDLSERKIVSPGDGWEIDRLHQVTALIEDRQGWAPEPGAIYAARSGEVRERATSKVVRRADGSRKGCATRTRAAPERWQTPEYAAVADALRTAQTWQDLHNRLLECDTTYLPKGSGAEITIARSRMKATAFGREFAYRRMTERLGEYTPDLLAVRDPYQIYQDALRAERMRVRDALNETLADLAERRKRAIRKVIAEKAAIDAMIAEARLQLVFDLAEAEVKRAFDRARLTIAQNALRREAWYKVDCPAAITVKLPNLIYAPNAARDKTIASAHGLTSRAGDFAVEYRSHDDSLALTDIGVLLIVHRIDRSAIAAGLAMANERGEAIAVAGTDEFLNVCREIAIEHGYALVREGGAQLYIPPTEAQSAPASLAPSDERKPSETCPEPSPEGTPHPGSSRRGEAPSLSSQQSQTLSGQEPEEVEDEPSYAVMRWAARKAKERGRGIGD